MCAPDRVDPPDKRESRPCEKAALPRKDTHGLDIVTIRRRRHRFNYRDHRVAAELIRSSLRACGGTVQR